MRILNSKILNKQSLLSLILLVYFSFKDLFISSYHLTSSYSIPIFLSLHDFHLMISIFQSLSYEDQEFKKNALDMCLGRLKILEYDQGLLLPHPKAMIL
jgi:hypothetical protein